MCKRNFRKQIPFLVACCLILILLICGSPTANAASNSITLTSASQDVLIGSTLQITASSTVTSWTSSDTNIATINSSGLVTGHMAGEVTITAAGGAGSATIKIYVRMADGYYRIYNNYSTYYLGVDDFSIKSGTNVINRSRYTQSPYCYSQIWKITYAGNGNYTIRAMHYDDLWLYKDYSKACVYDIDGTDGSSTLSNFAQWKIQAYGGSYVIRSKFNTYEALCSNSSSFDSPVTVEICVGSPSSSSFRWYFYSATVPIGMVLYDSATKLPVDSDTIKYMENARTESLAAIEVMPYIHCEAGTTYTTEITSSNVLVASEYATGSSIRAYSLGDATISYNVYFNGDASPFSASFQLKVIQYNVMLMSYVEWSSDYGSYAERDAYFTDTASAFLMRYDRVHTVRYENSQDQQGNVVIPFLDLRNYLERSRFLYIHTHGKQDGIQASNGLFLESVDLNNSDLSDLKLAVLLTCDTGLGGYTPSNITNNTPANIVEKMISRGAETVIGFNDTIPFVAANEYGSLFAQYYVLQGYSAQGAADQINNLGLSTIASNAVVGGNGDNMYYS